MIEFGEWLPDLPDFENPGATVIKNALPFGDSYKQWPDLSVYSGAITARCQGAIAGRDNSGNVYNFAGDATKLYKLGTDATWSDVSGATYTITSDEQWSATQWGNQILFANINDNIQSWTMGTSSAFADLSATAPRARHIFSVRDFVVVANTYDSTDGSAPYRVRWCPINNPGGDWTVSATTQADYNDLAGDGGWCMGGVGGEYGVVFQERAIWRMTYVGSPDIFQFDKVEKNRGTPASGSIIPVGNWSAYLGQEGFFIFDGSQSIPIGVNKIDKTFYTDLDQSYTYRICSAVDPINQIIFWAYPGSGNTGGNPNKILAYNYSPSATKRWSYAEMDVEYLYRSFGQGYTLDTLDSVSSSLDLLGFSLDSRIWTGNTILLSAFDSNHKLNNFTGSALTATLETAEAEVVPGRRARVNKVRPVVDGGTVTMQLGTRNTLQDSVTWSTASSTNTTGDCCIRSNARYHRARVNISGGFTHAQGVEVVEAHPGGKR